MKYTVIFIMILMLSLGCSREQEKPLVITTSLWVGNLPFIYALEKGYIDKTKIKLHVVSSLGESVSLYDSGIIDGFTGTQTEAGRVKEKGSLVPVIIYDRSMGADSVVSNMDCGLLRSEKYLGLNVYYEKNTVNEDMLNFFLEEEFLVKNHDTVVFTAISQEEMLNRDFSGENAVVITYYPYTSSYLDKGFCEVMNSADDRAVIIDALFVDRQKAKERRADITKLKESLNLSVKMLKNNPDEFYSVVKNYIKDQPYREFRGSLDKIKWLESKQNAQEVRQLADKLKLETEELLLD